MSNFMPDHPVSKMKQPDHKKLAAQKQKAIENQPGANNMASHTLIDLTAPGQGLKPV